ncbi:MAG: AraC family transcriptional regulator [Clostridia bacterium]|nr:AraC family transcriptional regulator [Clostridia bacterium]
MGKIKKFFSNLLPLRFRTKNILLMRFVIGNFLVVFFAVAILSVFSVRKSLQTVSQNTDEFTDHQIKFAASNADYFLNEIYRILTTFNTTPNANNIFSFNKWTQEDKNNLDFFNWMNSLRQYIGNYDFIHNLVIYSNNNIIDSDSGIHLPSSYYDWDALSDIHMAAKQNHNSYAPFISNLRILNGDTPVISFAVPLNSANTDFSAGMVMANIKPSYLSEKLGNGRIDSKHMLFIYDSDYGIITGPNHNYDTAAVTSTLNSYLNTPNNNSYNIDGINYTIRMQKSKAADNWTYFLLYDITQDINKRHSLIALYVIILIFIILACFVSVWLISSYCYKPLNNIVSNLNIQFNSPSEDKTLDHAKTISKHIDTLQNELNQKMQFIADNMPEIRRLAISNILNKQSGMSNTELKASLSKCEIIFDDKYYYVMLFSIDKYRDLLSHSDPNHVSNTLTYTFEVIYKLLSQSLNAAGIHTEYNRYAVIINTAQPMELSETVLLHQKINSVLTDQYSLTVSLCVSEYTTSLDKIAGLYEQVVIQERHRFNLGYEALITCPYNKCYENADINTITKHTNHIIQNMLQNNPEQLILDTEKFLSALQSSEPDYVYRNVFKLLNNIEKVYHSKTSDYDFNIIYKQLGNFFSYATFSEFSDWLTSNIIKLSSACANSGNHNTAKKIKEYIDIYYYNDLSLDSLAEKFKLSPTYISKLFVESFNVGFLTYLSDIRIEAAKSFLADTNLPISVISEKVGFVNYNTFSRTFKRYTGMSAKSYRANHPSE